LDILRLELLTQNWIDGRPDDGMDFCAHGKVLLRINDIILSEGDDGDWTVVSSALRLMKSGLHGYDSRNDLELIPCCGYLRLFPSCPNYITWDAEIEGDIIVVSNVESSRNEKDGLTRLKGSFRIDHKQYLVQVLIFASKVLGFYFSHMPRQFTDPFDEKEYGLFWEEFHEYYQILKAKCASHKDLSGPGER
jgi:hypothetical protein